MLVKLIEIERGLRGGTSQLREIYINSKHIISVSEDVVNRDGLIAEATNLGLNGDVRFSKVVVQEGNTPRVVIVIGKPSEVFHKIRKRQILRG